MSPTDIETLGKAWGLISGGGPWVIVTGGVLWFFQQWQAGNIFNGKQLADARQDWRDRLTDATDQMREWRQAAKDGLAALTELKNESRSLRDEVARLRDEVLRLQRGAGA